VPAEPAAGFRSASLVPGPAFDPRCSPPRKLRRMVSVMNLTGYVVVGAYRSHAGLRLPDHRCRTVSGCTPRRVIGARSADRFGRSPRAADRARRHGDLDDRPAVGRERLGDRRPVLGLGWDVELLLFVPRNLVLQPRRSTSRRAREALGFNDLLGALFGASLALGSAVTRSTRSASARLSQRATVIVAAPVLLIARTASAPLQASLPEPPALARRRVYALAREARPLSHFAVLASGIRSVANDSKEGERRGGGHDDTDPPPPAHERTTRVPDLKPPLVRIRTAAHKPGPVTSSSRRRWFVAQAGPMIMDNRWRGGLVQAAEHGAASPTSRVQSLPRQARALPGAGARLERRSRDGWYVMLRHVVIAPSQRSARERSRRRRGTSSHHQKRHGPVSRCTTGYGSDLSPSAP